METERFATSSMASMVQTRSIQRILAPIAAQVSQLILLNESAGGTKPSNLVPFAQQVLRAAEDLVEVGRHLVSQSADEELCSEMPKACDHMKTTGRDVLMAVQRLQAEPQSDTAKKNMVTAAGRLLNAVMKVLLVSDSWEVRKIIDAAHVVLANLKQLHNVQTMRILVEPFKTLAESVVTVSNLCDRRQQDLTNPELKAKIVAAVDSLHRSVPLLSAAMQSYVRYPINAQAKARRDFVSSQVSDAIADIVSLMKAQLPNGSSSVQRKEPNVREEEGHYASKIDNLIRCLSPNQRSPLAPEFYQHVGDVVRNSMAVGSLSGEKEKEPIVSSCKQILKQRTIIRDHSENIVDNPGFLQLRSDYDHSCEDLAKELLVMEKLVSLAVIGQCVDVFVETTEPFDRMVKASTVTLREKKVLRESDCIRILEPLEETFHEHTDRMCQLGNFTSGSSRDMQKSAAILQTVRSLERLDAEVFPACLAVRQDLLDKTAVRHLKLIHREWHNEVQRLVEGVDAVVDANRFTEIAESYMESDLEECRQAEVISDRDLLAEATNNLLGRAKRVVRVATNQMEASEDPLFRNGLQVYINQLEQATAFVKSGARKTLSHFQHKRAHEQLAERGSQLLDCVRRVARAALGKDHPGVLSPLREGVRDAKRPQSPDFPALYEEEHNVSRLRFSNVSYLSAPLPPSAGVLASDPALESTSSLLSALSLTKDSPTISANKAVTLTYPMAGLVRVLFNSDRKTADKLCREAESRIVFLGGLLGKASGRSQDVQLRSKLESLASRLLTQTTDLIQHVKSATAPSATAQLHLAQAWTTLVNDVVASLKDAIGCWGLPGNRLLEKSLLGETDCLDGEIETLNSHRQNVQRLVQTVTKTGPDQSQLAYSPSRCQQLQQEASDWTKLTHSLISAANETVINPGDPLLQDLVERRWLEWSLAQLHLVTIMEDVTVQTSHVTSTLTTVATAAGSQEKVAEHVQKMRTFASKISHMAESLQSCSCGSPHQEVLQHTADSLGKLTGQLADAVFNCSRGVGSSKDFNDGKKRLHMDMTLVKVEWAAKIQLLSGLIDDVSGDMTTPLDRLTGAALATSQATGSSHQELLDELQTQSDNLCQAASWVRQSVTAALKPVHGGPLRTAVFTAVDDLCRLTPIAVTQSRDIADGQVIPKHELTLVKRQWACSAKAVTAGLQCLPEVASSIVKDITQALRCQSYLATPRGSPTSISPQHALLLQSLPKRGTFAPSDHSTPLRHPWQSPSCNHLRMTSSSSSGHPGCQRRSGQDEIDGGGGGPTSAEVDPKSPYRNRVLGLKDFPRDPKLTSTRSTPTLQTPRATGGRDYHAGFVYNKCSSSLAAAASVLKLEADKWEDDSNSIVMVAKTISAQVQDMAKYARRINDLQAKEELINSAKAIAANGKVIYRFAEIIAEHCLDERIGDDLKVCSSNIPSLCTQLNIVASVKMATPDDDTTDIVLTKNVDNLIEGILRTLNAAEAACIKGLRAMTGGSQDEHEATALASQWRRTLDQHRYRDSSHHEVDVLGLRRVPRNMAAPSLSQILAQR